MATTRRRRRTPAPFAQVFVGPFVSDEHPSGMPTPSLAFLLRRVACSQATRAVPDPAPPPLVSHPSPISASPEHAAGGPCGCIDGGDRANPQIPSPVSRSLSLLDWVPVRSARHRTALAAVKCTTRKRGCQEASSGPLRDFVSRHRSRGRRGASLDGLPLPSAATA